MKPLSSLSRRAAICVGASALALSGMPCRAAPSRSSFGEEVTEEVHDIESVAADFAQALCDQVHSSAWSPNDVIVAFHTSGDGLVGEDVEGRNDVSLAILMHDELRGRKVRSTFGFKVETVGDRTFLPVSDGGGKVVRSIIASINTKIFFPNQNRPTIYIPASFQFERDLKSQTARVVMTYSMDGNTFSARRTVKDESLRERSA